MPEILADAVRGHLNAGRISLARDLLDTEPELVSTGVDAEIESHASQWRVRAADAISAAQQEIGKAAHSSFLTAQEETELQGKLKRFQLAFDENPGRPDRMEGGCAAIKDELEELSFRSATISLSA